MIAGPMQRSTLMRKRTQLIVSALVAGAALAAAVPAQAQYSQQRDGWYGDRDGRYDDRYDRQNYGEARAIRAQIDQLQQRVDRVDNRDRISEREAATLRRAVWNLRQQFRDYSRNGLSQREAQILRDSIARIRDRLRYERRDNDGRRW